MNSAVRQLFLGYILGFFVGAAIMAVIGRILLCG